MSLKAGRVGVALDQVDEFGKIKSEAASGYTKQEADAKFETKTEAATALAEKQPTTLSVPIEMLSGTKLTVESALQGLQSDKVDNSVSDGTVTSNFTVSTDTKLAKMGKIVSASIKITGVTASPYNEIVCVIPTGFRPVNRIDAIAYLGGELGSFTLYTNGNVQISKAMENSALYINATWITN